MPDDFYDHLTFEEHVKLEFHDDFRRKKAHFLKQFLPAARGAFLDVGCGSGFDLYHLTRNAQSPGSSRGAHWVGLDLSFNMLTQTRQYLARAGQQASLVQADAKALPFCNDAFDAVHSHELSVFNYGSVDERVRVLSEQRRVCKSGGTIVTVLPQRNQEGFLPTGEPQMRYLFRSAGLQFVRAVYHLGKLPWFSTPKILTLLQRVVPRPVAWRLLKSPEEYLRQGAFMIVGIGEKVVQQEGDGR